MTSAGVIYQKISDCMRDIEAIAKANRNAAQGYNFRGIDDVYNELHPILAKHGVFTVPSVLNDRSEERTSKSGSAMIYRILTMAYAFRASDGSEVVATVIGEGMDSGDKAANKAMAVAHKYALMQVFCIPTKEAKDPEHESPEVKPREPIKLRFDPENKAQSVRARILIEKESGDIFDPAKADAILLRLKGVPLDDVAAKVKELVNT